MVIEFIQYMFKTYNGEYVSKERILKAYWEYKTGKKDPHNSGRKVDKSS